MADVKIKVLSSGRIPGYPVNGPILSPITVDEKVAMRYINSGLRVVVWNEQLQDFVDYDSIDMVDFFHDKDKIVNADDEGHKCPVCGEDRHGLLDRTRVKNTPTGINSYSVKHESLMPGDPVEKIFSIPETVIEDDAYEPAPFPIDRSMCYSKPAIKEPEEEIPDCLIDMDDFEEK